MKYFRLLYEIKGRLTFLFIECVMINVPACKTLICPIERIIVYLLLVTLKLKSADWLVLVLLSLTDRIIHSEWNGKLNIKHPKHKYYMTTVAADLIQKVPVVKLNMLQMFDRGKIWTFQPTSLVEHVTANNSYQLEFYLTIFDEVYAVLVWVGTGWCGTPVMKNEFSHLKMVSSG